MIEKNKQQVPEVSHFDLEITQAKKQLQFFRTLAIFFAGLIVGFVTLGILANVVDNQARKNAIIEVDNSDYTPAVSKAPSAITQYPTETPVPKVPVDVGNISYLSQPKIIPALNVFDKNESSFADCVKNVSFQQTADTSNGYKLVNLIFTESCGMGEFTVLQRLLVDKNNLIYKVVDPDQKYPASNYLVDLPQTDNNFIGIKTPSNLSINLGNFEKIFNYGGMISFTEIKNPTLLEDTSYGKLYVSYNKNNNSGVSFRNIVLRLKDDTIVYYQTKTDFFTDDQVPSITWNNGLKNADQFTNGPRTHCGSSINDIFQEDAFKQSDIAIAGYLASGQPIYKIINKTNTWLSSAYEQHPYEGTDVDKKITFDEFIVKPTHFLWQDNLKDWHYYTNDQFAIAAECGKPVIYLYPEKDTNVSVRVGANVTKSEPLYPQNGWTVLAHPDGQINYQGSFYPNLFWEGTGFGLYPSLENKGFIVPQSKLISTIIAQLKLQGLNDQESSDFMEFWKAKLPKTPYVRLTWLTTFEMNTLAPLKVSPTPQTVIRVFLDFQGLDKPINLVPQKLSSPKRNGFTLVEWGGLLIK